MQEKSENIFGKKWNIRISQNSTSNIESIEETEENHKQQTLQSFNNSEEFKKIKQLFPNAVVKDVKVS